MNHTATPSRTMNIIPPITIPAIAPTLSPAFELSIGLLVVFPESCEVENAVESSVLVMNIPVEFPDKADVDEAEVVPSPVLLPLPPAVEEALPVVALPDDIDVDIELVSAALVTVS